MASAELSRSIGKVVGYPPLSELSDLQRRELHEALLEADAFGGSVWEVAGGDSEGGADPAEAARCYQRLVLATDAVAVAIEAVRVGAVDVHGL